MRIFNLRKRKKRGIPDKKIIPPPPTSIEVNQAIQNIATQMNGQLRGGINEIAREQNLETLIYGLNMIYNLGVEYGEEKGFAAAIASR